MSTAKRLLMALMFAVVAGLASLVAGPVQQADAAIPADKIGVAGSTLQILSPAQDVTLLTATLHNSTTADLLLSVTTECALWTNITAPDSEAVASVKIWTEIDGRPIPVTSDPAQGGPDDGKVVFCNRDFKIQSLLSPDAMLQLFLKTKTANAFNWVTFNVGNGDHTITVKARLDQQVTGIGFALAAVGKRTLIVEPGHLANDATI